VTWSPEGEVRVIPTPADAHTLVAADINDAGEVAGMVVALNGKYKEAFVWSESVGLRRSGSIGGEVVVTAISASGTVVGYTFSGQTYRSFSWTPANVFAPPSGRRFIANGINRAGWIVGNDSVGGPVRWSEGTGFERLRPTADACTVAIDVNDKDEILGWAGNNRGFGCAAEKWIVWRSPDTPTEIFRCPSDAKCDFNLVSFNANGEVAGNSGGNVVRMRTTPRVELIHTLPLAYATDMNDLGDVVGFTEDAKPFLMNGAGNVRYLPLPSGRTLGEPRAINNRGQVVGLVGDLAN
jgi:hypothetical protein